MPILDLDQLQLLCKSENSKRLIRESLDSYRVGAYRATVVVTWIAVVYDIIDKLREIALTGDAQAKKKIEEFEDIQKRGDLENALTFERNILAEAKHPFELISAQEETDLKRLQADRNRCAHPNLIREGEVYCPSAEQARLHIRNAIEILLSRPPVQGKAALSMLQSEVDSTFFPENEDDAFTVLQTSPISRGKDNLIRVFLRGAISSCIKEELEAKKIRQRVAAIRAISRMHPNFVRTELDSWFPIMLSKIADDEIVRLVKFLEYLPDYESRIDEAMTVKLSSFIEALDESNEVKLLPVATAVEITKSSAGEYLSALIELPGSTKRAESILDEYRLRSKTIPHIALKAIAEKYCGSTGFDSANSIAKELVVPNIQSFDKALSLRLIEAGNNGQVAQSFEHSTVLSALKSAKILSPTEFDTALSGTSYGTKFSGYLHNPPAPPAPQLVPASVPVVPQTVSPPE